MSIFTALHGNDIAAITNTLIRHELENNGYTEVTREPRRRAASDFWTASSPAEDRVLFSITSRAIGKGESRGVHIDSRDVVSMNEIAKSKGATLGLVFAYVDHNEGTNPALNIVIIPTVPASPGDVSVGVEHGPLAISEAGVARLRIGRENFLDELRSIGGHLSSAIGGISF